jgi:hypothetical protein
MRMRQTVRVKKSTHARKSSRVTAIGAGVIVLVVTCVIGAVMLIAARQPSETLEMTSADVRPAAPAPGQPKKTLATRASAADAVMASTLATDATAVNAPAEASAKATSKSDPVTIMGCLERDDNRFRLKETFGEHAPKSRSWKSGFLKKAPASIEVIDASRNLKLATHVGQRISVTGVVVNHEMQVRSLKRVAASCEASFNTLDQ